MSLLKVLGGLALSLGLSATQSAYAGGASGVPGTLDVTLDPTGGLNMSLVGPLSYPTVNTVTYVTGISRSNTGAANLSALSSVISTACTAGGHASIQLPPGAYSLDATSASITVNCNNLTINGAGYGTTTITVAGSNPLFNVIPGTGASSASGITFSNMTLARTDSPGPGTATIRADHVSGITFRGMHIQGGCPDVELLATSYYYFDPDSTIGGVNSNVSCSALLVHRIGTGTVTTAGSTASGATTINVALTTGFERGETLIGTNIPAADLILGVAPTALTLSLATTGVINASTSLTITDRNPANGYFCAIANSGGAFTIRVGGTNYGHMINVGDTDGLTMCSNHVAWSKGSAFYAQPEHSDDGIDDIQFDSNLILDPSGGFGGIEVEPYGAVALDNTGNATTFGAPLKETMSAGSTTITLSAAPSSDVTGYKIVSNCTAAGTTVASGGAGTSPVLSALPLCTLTGSAVATSWAYFYPTGFTGHDNLWLVNGKIESQAGAGIYWADCSATAIGTFDFLANDNAGPAMDVRCGIGGKIDGWFIANGKNNAGIGVVTVEGNAGVWEVTGQYANGSGFSMPGIRRTGQASLLHLGAPIFKDTFTPNLSVGCCTLVNNAIADISFVISGGSAAITAGQKGYLPVDFACTIGQSRLVADRSGSIVIDVWKKAAAVPTVADTIDASALPTLSSAQLATDATLTGWTTSVAAGDIIGYNVNSASTVTQVTLTLKCTKS